MSSRPPKFPKPKLPPGFTPRQFGASKPRKPRTDFETTLQIQTVNFLRLALPKDAVLHHSHNEGKRSKADAAKAKAMGQRAGFPDIIIFLRGEVYMIELKYGKNGQTDAQAEVQADMAATGFENYAVCWTLPEVVAALEGWGVKLKSVGII